MSSADHRLGPDLDGIIAGYLSAQDRGEAPTVDELLELHPEHADRLRQFFQTEHGIRRLSSETEVTSVDPIGPETSRFGDYEIIELIARGGMGAVYKVRQSSLGRIVALKMILGGRFASEEQVERLRREAHAVASLEHPNIVPIHEVGEQEGIPFFSMQYVDGGSLREQITRFREDPRAAARLMETVALAVHAVHERGILHRDLKPGNILLEKDGTPKITDFGLAKHIEDDHTLTMAGSAVGTPHYMSPEQATGRVERIGVASDVYGLGAVLYHLLAGRAPFHGENSFTVLRKVQEEPPVAVRSLRADVPRDLATICSKCLEKEPRHRYSSAAELAADLRRFLHHEPIAARPTPLVMRTRLWCRRNPAAVVVLSLLTVIAVGSLFAALEFGEERDAARSAETRAGERLRESLITEARALRYTSEAGRRKSGLRSLAQAAAIRPGVEVRNEAIAYLALIDLEFSGDWPGFPPGSTTVAVDSQYEHYARGARSGAVSVRRLRDDVELATLAPFQVTVHHLLFSPDGEYLAATTSQSDAVVFRWRTGEKILDLGKTVNQKSIDFHPTDDVLVVSSTDDLIRWFDLGSAAELRAVPCYDAGRLSFDPSGQRLAVVRGSTSVSLMDVASGRITDTFDHPEDIFAASWSADGRRILVPCEDRNVYGWDVITGESVGVYGRHEDKAIEACFTHDSRFVISGGYDGRIRVWETRSGAAVLTAPGGIPGSLRLGEDRQHFGLVSEAPDLRLARIERSPVLHTCDGPGPRTHTGLAIDPRGQILATCHLEGVRLWDLESGDALAYLPTPSSFSCQFEPTGESLITCGRSGVFRWPMTLAAAGRRLELGPPERLFGHLSPKRALLDPEGRHIAVITESRLGFGADIHYHDWLDLEAPPRVINHWGVHSLAFSNDGRWLASATWNGQDVVVWDLQQPQPGLIHLIKEYVNATVTFSPRGTWLAAVLGREYRFFRTGEWGSPFWVVPRDDPEVIPGPVAIRADERLLALVQNKTEVALFDPVRRQELARLASPRDHVIHDLLFSPDGRYLVAATDPIEVWDLHALEAGLVELGLHWDTETGVGTAVPATLGQPVAPSAVEVRLGELSNPDLWPDGTFPLLADAALQHCQRRLSEHPEDAEVRLLRARILARLDRVLEAIAELDAALEVAGEPTHLLRERAGLCERAGLDARAIDDYQAILMREQSDLAARVRRATLLLRHGETEKASQDLARLAAGPFAEGRLAADTAWLLAIAPPPAGNPTVAEGLARWTCALESDRSEHLRVLAAACYRGGKYAEALGFIERAVAVDARGVGARAGGTTLDYLLMGLCQHHLGNRERTISSLSRGLDWRTRSRHGRPIEELEVFLDEARRIHGER